MESIFDIPRSRAFLKYLIPGLVAMLAVSCYSFVDTFVIGLSLNANAVGAMGVCTPVVNTMHSLGFLFGGGGAVRYLYLKNRGEYKKAHSVFTLAWIVIGVLWLLFAVFGNIYTSEIVSYLGATSGNADFACEYLHWIFSLSGVFMLDMALVNFMRNDDHPNLVMISTIISVVLNVILDFVFVAGLNLGMAGAAGATCLSSFVSVAINFIYSRVKSEHLKFGLCVSHVKELGKMFSLGLSPFVLELALAVISIVFVKEAGIKYGDAGVSAYTCIMTLNLICYSLIDGVATSVQPLISMCTVKKDYKRRKSFLVYEMTLALALGITFCIVLEIFRGFFCSLFLSGDETALSLAAGGLAPYAFAFPFMAVSVVTGLYLQAKDVSVPAFILLLCRSLVFPVAALYILKLLGVENFIFLGVPIGEGLAALFAIVSLISDKYMEKKQKGSYALGRTLKIV